MRILIVHNHYGDYAAGGEEIVMRGEAALLRNHGHEVRVYERTNAEIIRRNIWGKVKAFKNMTWSCEGFRAIAEEIRNFRPDVMHVHNYWLVLTPSIFAAAKECGVKTIFTLHNFRLICPGNQLLRDGKVCELCLHGNPFRVLIHRCFPGKSFFKSFLSLILYRETKKKGFLSEWVDAYITLSSFARSRFIEAGIPENKIFVKPNFMDDPADDVPKSTKLVKGAFFAGRVSSEKGIRTLLKAWNGLDYPLLVAGDGPLLAEMRCNAPDTVEFLGWLSRNDTLQRLCSADFFIFPSECYEGFPLSLLEAMAFGKAIIASDLGPRREMIDDGVSGLFFEAGNTADLRTKIETLIRDKALRKRLGQSARETYLSRYTPGKNYALLMSVYKHVLQAQ